MPDAPDGYKYRIQSAKALLGDLGELAVRLGSPVSFNREGTVIWFTDMSYGSTPFTPASEGLGWDISPIAGLAMTGPLGLQLTAGRTDGASITLYRTFAPQALNKWGLEVGAYFPDTFKEFHLILGWYDGTVAHRGRIIFSDVDQKIYYRDENNNPIEIGTMPELVSIYGQIQNIKLVIDVVKYEYVRLILNTVTYDLSGITLWTADAGDNPQSRLAIQLYSNSGDNDKAVIDYVICTIDEI